MTSKASALFNDFSSVFSTDLILADKLFFNSLMFKSRLFRLLFVILFVLCLLIGMGILVKASGSSESCPNWPKCFGYWVPPSCECYLPDDYRITYKIASGADFNYVIAKVWMMSIFLYTETFALCLLFIHFLISLQMRISRTGILVSMFAFLILLLEMLHILTNIGSTRNN